LTAGSRRFVLAVLFVAALSPRLYHVRSPYMNFADHNTANFSIFARNYLLHGYAGTGLGQVRNVGPADPGDLVVFAHHPPTIALLTSLSFRIAGVSEWSARALPLALSAATCPLIFLLGARLFGPWAALLAAGVFAFAPGAVYYGQMLDHEAFVTFLGLLCLLAWVRHAETGARRWWLFCLALVAATALVDWPGAYLAPAIAVAAALTPSMRGRRVRMALSAFSAAAAALAVVAIHILVLKGSWSDLLASLSFRVRSSPELPFTWGEYLYRIRLNLEYALTPPIVLMAAAGVALILIRLLAFGRDREGGPGATGARARAEPIPAFATAAAIGFFSIAHHAIFRNACHFNEHLIYYLLPPAALLAASAPSLLSGFLPRRWPMAAAAVAVLAALVPLGAFGARSAPQVRAYFNDLSVPGWPILGMALHRIVPAEDVLLSTENLANPQFLHYLDRAILNRIGLSDIEGGGTAGAFLLRDRNAPASEPLLSFLAPFPPGSLLNFALHDLTPGSPPPEFPPLAPPEALWQPVEVRFGDSLLLTMTFVAPVHLEVEPLGSVESYLGVRWTPERASSRMVHGTFVWERLDGGSGPLIPGYALLPAGGAGARAPALWPLPAEAADLSNLEPGESLRQERDWFFGEWLPDGEYEVRVEVGDGAHALPVAVGGGPSGGRDYLAAEVRVSSGG